MNPKIFISYRRKDSQDISRSIFDYLVGSFGKEAVFLDTDSIRPGQLFPDRLKNELMNATVILYIIGDRWASLTGDDGKSRLSDPNDWVRQELEIGLEQKQKKGDELNIIPVWVGEDKVQLDPNQLPESIRDICRYNFYELRRGMHYAHDLKELADHILERNTSLVRLKEICSQISLRRLSQFEAKLDPEVYYHREDIQSHIDSFLESESKSYFVLLGESGIGKSAFLWGVSQRLSYDPSYKRVLFLFADATKHVRRESNIIDSMLDDLVNYAGIQVDKLFADLQQINAIEPIRFIFIIDAVNEFENAKMVAAMMKKADDLLGLYPWLRLIISCRPHFWSYVLEPAAALGIAEKYFYRPDIKSKDLFVLIKRLTDAQTNSMYESYRKKYAFGPEQFSQLQPAIQKRLRDPLILKIIAEIAKGKNINDFGKYILVDTKAIPKYIRILIEDKILPAKGTEVFLESICSKGFVQLGYCNNYVLKTTLFELMKSSNEFSNFDLDELEQYIARFLAAAIFKEDQSGHITFCFERFYGFYLGLHLKEMAKTNNIVDCT